jgi:hypothetical protein
MTVVPTATKEIAAAIVNLDLSLIKLYKLNDKTFGSVPFSQIPASF